MLRKGHDDLYKAPIIIEERRKQKAERREIRSSLLILDLKDGKLYRIQESIWEESCV